MQTTKQLPKGLSLFREPKRSYKFMIDEMGKCCDENPDCEYNKECKRLFDNRCTEWKLNRQRIAKSYRQPTATERYSNWMPVLHLKDIAGTAGTDGV